MVGRYAAARPAMEEDCWLGPWRPYALPIDMMPIAHIEMAGGEGFDRRIKGAHRAILEKLRANGNAACPCA
jgi:hypothetical protein